MNPTDTLGAHRPTDDDLLTAWPASDRYAVWSSLKGRLASDLAPVARRGSLHNPARRRLRRWVRQPRPSRWPSPWDPLYSVPMATRAPKP